jgi:hypothetical protein
MAKVAPINRDRFAIFQDAHKVPIDFGIAKRWPSVGSTLFQEVFHATLLRSCKEQFARVGIVKVNHIRFGGPSFLQKGGLFKVSRVFSVMTTTESTNND